MTAPWINDEPDYTLELVYQELLEEIERVLPRLTQEERLLVVALVTDTCRGCYAADTTCHCMNDE